MEINSQINVWTAKVFYKRNAYADIALLVFDALIADAYKKESQKLCRTIDFSINLRKWQCSTTTGGGTHLPLRTQNLNHRRAEWMCMNYQIGKT